MLTLSLGAITFWTALDYESPGVTMHFQVLLEEVEAAGLALHLAHGRREEKFTSRTFLAPLKGYILGLTYSAMYVVAHQTVILML